MKIIEKEYIIKSMPMTCASSEAESKKYNYVVGKSGCIWLYAVQDNSADNIYVSGGKNSDGFAGRTLTFPLIDGKELKLAGPWHANSHDLFKDTGIDLRDKNLTFVVIGLGRETKKTEKGRLDIMLDVIYKDKEPTIGYFDRGDRLAQEIANKIKRPVFYYIQSCGGSSSSKIEPNIGA